MQLLLFLSPYTAEILMSFGQIYVPYSLVQRIFMYLMLIFLIILYFFYYWLPLLEHVLQFVQPKNPFKFKIDLFFPKNSFFFAENSSQLDQTVDVL